MPLTLVGRVAFAVVLGLRALVVSTRLSAEWCSAYGLWCHDCIDGEAAVSTAREVAVHTVRMSVPCQTEVCCEMLAPNSGQCAISALDAGDSCNSGSGMQHGVCAAVIVCSCVQCSVQPAIEQIGLSAVDAANWC